MTRLTFAAGALTAFVPFSLAAAAADEAGKPNKLTQEQIAGGWILLFDGETSFGWKVEGDAKVEATGLQLGGDKDTLARTTSEFCCFELHFVYRGAAKGAQLLFSDQTFDLKPTGDGDTWLQGLARVEMRNGQRAVSVTTLPPGEHPGRQAATSTREGAARGPVGFKVPAGSRLTVRDIRLKPLSMKTLFNGKDLTGWKIIPGQKSKFTATEKGELNIKDGGGEIQTEGQWADFILQLDVFSNGKHLNSGIFFRAKPGEFWQGYEAQIRNEWDGYSGDGSTAGKPEDRTKPRDFGTGGIYNRQPSRKVVSNDKEWFTYTVLAHGNHMATWVNGYQTADFFDNAQDASTARKGRYLGKGAISLQGHDPTTDLSFRNIKLQELPAKDQ